MFGDDDVIQRCLQFIGTMAFEVQLLYTVALSLAFVEANIVQNCTTNACDVKTCVNITQRCDQSCYTSNCQMACSSPQGCAMNCRNGGCSSLSCDVPYSSGSVSLFHCTRCIPFARIYTPLA